jgi:cell division septation protein DedD
MVKTNDYFRDEKGASGRQLVLMFLAAVAVCAVFFSLGFVVGYNHAPSKGAPATENVSSGGDIPPPVIPTAGGSGLASRQGVQTESISQIPESVPPPERPQPLSPEPAEKEQAPPVNTARKTVLNTSAAGSKLAVVARSRSASTVPANSSSHFAVQVMASRTQSDAENLLNILKSRGYPVYMVTPQQAHTRDQLYRVQVGPFVTRVAADTTRDKLVGEGFRPFVVH